MISQSAKLAPSIAAGDNGKLAAEAANLEAWGADWIHVDIMDGLFAPNLTFGPATVKAIRAATTLTLDCHLMLQQPEKYCEAFLRAGGDIITVHAEALTKDSLAFVESKVRQYNAKLGVAFKPATGLDSVDLNKWNVSLITVMSVNPGFSGQKFKPEVVPKIRQARQLFGHGDHIEIEVDGGVDQTNAKMLVQEGATVLVAGNSVFGRPDPRAALEELRMIVSSSSNLQELTK